MKLTILTLLLILVSCAENTAFTVQDRWWEWERQVCIDYTECLPTVKSGGGITVQCSTKTRVLCMGTEKGVALPAVPPELYCAGSYHRDGIRYLATIKADGEKERRVSFNKDMWDMMVTGNKVCLRVMMGWANKCKGE